MMMFHPIHLSKCQMEVNAQNKQLEITLHVYIDDLQEIIEQRGSPDLFLATKKEIHTADSFIHAYLVDHLKIMNGGQPVAFTWLGKEQSDDLMAFWCYLETDAIEEDLGLSVTYSVLQDLYVDQQNILNVISSDGDEAYFLCRKGDNIARME